MIEKKRLVNKKTALGLGECRNCFRSVEITCTEIFFHFIFPKNLSEKAQYKLLGNSINVKVVNILMNYLFN